MTDLFYGWSLEAGIGGIALSVLVILFGSFLKQKLFPKLTQKQSFTLLMAFLFMVWSAAIFSLYIYYDLTKSRAQAENIKSEIMNIGDEINEKVEANQIADIDFAAYQKKIKMDANWIDNFEKSKHYKHLDPGEKAQLDSTKLQLDNLLKATNTLKEIDSISRSNNTNINLPRNATRRVYENDGLRELENYRSRIQIENNARVNLPATNNR